ncbi:MAG: FAD:protein FMN transferase [Firmicutes bacterium]|nr:FAD:protein FMN transferase [Bacillota bacterium]
MKEGFARLKTKDNGRKRLHLNTSGFYVVAALFIILALAVSIRLGLCPGLATGFSPAPAENGDGDGPVSGTRFMMGTVVTMKAYGPGAAGAVEQGFARVREIENKISVNIQASEVSKVNSEAGLRPVRVGRDAFDIARSALEYAALTSGKFDPAIGPIVKLWGIGTDHARVPDPDVLAAKLSLVDYRDVILDGNRHSIMLKRKGMALDFGGIAKGYAADEVVRIFKERGVKSAYVDLGGNVFVVGSRPDGRPWRIAIQDPRKERGFYVGIIEAKDKSIVTSGDYERYFEANGKRYHHIFDPATGRPADSGIMSATIISDRSIDGDALSTSVFILGPEKGLELVNRLPGIEAVIITTDRKVLISRGLAESGAFTITSKEYRLTR